MSEDAKDKAGAAPAKSKTMLIVIIAAAVGIAITAAVVLLVVPGLSSSTPESKTIAPMIPGQDIGPVLDMTDFVVNIQSEEGSAYLKVKLSLEMVAASATDPINKAMPVLRNEVLMYLSGLSLAEVRTAQQKQEIQNKLKEALNKRLKAELIRNIYFTEFVTQ